MATLSPRTRRPDDEIELAVHERRARHIIELVDAWGMTRDRQAHAPVARTPVPSPTSGDAVDGRGRTGRARSLTIVQSAAEDSDAGARPVR